MGLKDMISTASARVTDVAGIAESQIKVWMGDFKKATDTIEVFGFKIDKFNVSMAVLPEVNAVVSGRISQIQTTKVESLMVTHKDHSSTVMLLKGLLLAKQVADHLDGKLDGVSLHVKLGLPPSVDVELH